MNPPAFPAVEPKLELTKTAGPAPQPARGPRRISALVLGAAFACVLALAGLGVLAFRSEKPRSQSAGASQHQRRLDSLPTETVPARPARGPTTDNLRAAPAAEPDLETPPEQQRAPARSTEPAEWPPARAFTARCKVPGGRCAENCTPLAGGRCLDPCFIHTSECSPDCRKADGTCGWPPPDSE